MKILAKLFGDYKKEPTVEISVETDSDLKQTVYEKALYAARVEAVREAVEEALIQIVYTKEQIEQTRAAMASGVSYVNECVTKEYPKAVSNHYGRLGFSIDFTITKALAGQILEQMEEEDE